MDLVDPQWPVVFVLVATAVGLIYYFAPDAEQDWVWLTPGSLMATILWVIASLGLKVYYTLQPNANATYGAIGGVMVLMLWFYVSGLALLMGAELNSEIEHASPYGKDPGERVAGRKGGHRCARAARLRREAREGGDSDQADARRHQLRHRPAARDPGAAASSPAIS